MRCAALLASEPYHPAPPSEPLISPGAGELCIHEWHLRLKKAYAYPLQLKMVWCVWKLADPRIFWQVLEELVNASVLAGSVMF